MGSIEGVIILSPSNEPILHSHFLHPLPNYPILHVDQLAAKLEAAPSNEEALPLFYTDGIPSIPAEDEDGDAEGEEETDEGQAGSALVQIQHNRLRLVATFSQHGEWRNRAVGSIFADGIKISGSPSTAHILEQSAVKSGAILRQSID
jgi:hypothetical protein